MRRIVILASGGGSNAENIIQYFSGNPDVEIAAVLSNNRNAGVLDRCERLQVPAFYFNKASFSYSNSIVELLKSLRPSLIVLAGFLWKIPARLIKTFPNGIVNIHPALLPKYGGKGMYGNHVHQAVKDNTEPETGITIHYVNENYDEGAIIFQAKTSIASTDTVEDIAQKVHALEYEHFPKVIEQLLLKHGQET